MIEFDAGHLDWSEVQRRLQNFATSGFGRQDLGQIRPQANSERALEQIDFVLEAAEILKSGVRPFMESLDLFEPWYARVSRHGVLKPLEIKDSRSFCLEIIALQEVLKTHSGPWGNSLLSQLLDATEILSAIDHLITPRGEIRSDASERLYSLTKERENLNRQIQQTLDKLVHDHQMTNYLQDKFVTTREGRWVLPIKSGNQHSIDGVIHGSSQTKQTVFMEPSAVVPINNRLRQVEVEIDDEIERLLVDFSNYLVTQKGPLASSKDLMISADVIFAKAQLCNLIKAERVQFKNDEIFLVDLKHPLLEMSEKKPVANTVKLTSEKCILLLSGPNAGGKTVLLKAIGLAAMMSSCGLPICAGPGSYLPFFHAINIAIGDSQNVGEELSTFAAHLKILENSTRLKGLDHLILVDEICGSTDPEEGAALARAFIENFAANQCFAVITSHLGPLKTGWASDSQVLNGSLEYDAKTGRPTYQFLQGIPGDSLAIQTAKRIGIQSAIIQRATELLSPTTRQRLMGMEELDQLKSDIQLLQTQLRKDLAKSQAQKEKYETLIRDFEAAKDHELQRSIRQAEKRIEELIGQTKAEQTFKRHSSLQEIKTKLPEIVKSKPGVSSSGPMTTAEDFARHFPPGTKVFVKALNQDGLVQSTPNPKGEVMILSNSIRLSVHWTDLQSPHQAVNPTAHLVRRSQSVSGTSSVALQDQERNIDLRGLTSDEAISELEIQLDKAAQNKEERIKIIHGHGTETLKKTVRAYLSRSVYVKKWKAGSPEQGGDGVTWAELEV